MRNDKFIFLKEWLDLIDYYPEDKQLLLVKSIIEIGLEPETSISIYPSDLRPTLLLVKESIIKMQRKYKARSEAGKKGMASRWGQKEETEIEKFVNRYNSINGVIKCERISENRKSEIEKLLKKDSEKIDLLFSRISSNDFFLTSEKCKMKLTIDFLFNDDNFSKIIDGNYNNINDNKSKIKELWN